MKKKDKRFEVLREEYIGLTRSATIFVDKQTGVQYLSFTEGFSGGLTPLLDKNGKVIADGADNPIV